MAIILPDKPVPASEIDPRIFLMYGAPKVGKTKLLSELPGCLTLDGEEGTHYYDMLRIDVRDSKDYREVRKLILAAGTERAKKGFTGDDLFPYRYLAVDTIDNMEEFAIESATEKYRKSVIGKTFEGDSVLDLPKGGGYYYLREEVKSLIRELGSVCKHLILVSHLREKNLDKADTTISVQDISLMGKLSEIVCSMASAICYITRKRSSGDNPDIMMANFRTIGATTMGSRCPHLAGKTMVFDWAKIFTQDPTLNPTVKQ